MIWPTEKVYTSTAEVLNMRVNGKTIYSMETELSLGPMELNMKASMSLGRSTEKEH
jgi:hypothetical protein